MEKIKNLIEEMEQHLIEDKRPSEYFNELISNNDIVEMKPFNMISVFKKIEQSPIHHPEGDVWEHTMQVIDEAAKYREHAEDKELLMWGALLHDLGKAKTTKLRKGKITAYNHDKVGEELTYEFFENTNKSDEFIRKVARMVRWHMQVLFVVKNMPFADVPKMLEEVDLYDVALLNLSDRLGRRPMSKEKIDEELNNIILFVEKCGGDPEKIKRIIEKSY